MKISDMLNDDIKKRLNELSKIGRRKEEKDPATQRDWRVMMGEFRTTLHRGKGGAWK